MFDIITIGSATRDNFLRADYKIIDWPETPLKKAIILPFGEKLGVDEVYFTIGGNAANAGVTFSRQNFKTACAAKLGSDLAAEELKARLKKEGVNTKLIVHSKEKPTAYSVLLLMSPRSDSGRIGQGERTILSHHGASDTFTLSDLRLPKLRARWWYLSLSGESDAMYFDLLRFAKENSIKVAFNPSGYHIKHKRQEILDSLKDLAFLVLNEGEAAELLGMSFEDEGRVFKKLDELTPGIVAVTDGPNGVVVSDGKNIYRAGIFQEKEVIDRTGAGDAFGSGFVAGLMIKSKIKKQKSKTQIKNKKLEFNSEDIKYAIRLASANATSVVEHIGATEGTLTREQFEKDLRWQEFEIKTTLL